LSDQPFTTAPGVAEDEHSTALGNPAGQPAEGPAMAAPPADAADDHAEPLSASDQAHLDYMNEEEPEPARATFEDLGLSEELLRGVTDAGYIHPTPIQEQAIPIVLMGRDVLGCAQTGTGKTASFVLPMMDILAGSRAKARMPRSLILEPTRELALQVAENFVKYGQHMKLNHALLIGGESMNDQRDALDKGVDVLIATPGRLLDLFERGRVMLADCKVLVIDEADRMLDMGFIPDVERIVSMLPPLRQTLFFSATMAPEIRKLADAFLQNPKTITVSAPASVATTITAGLALVQEADKREALRRLIATQDVQNALIFCNRKRDVDILYKSLQKHGFSVGALHGDLAQSVRFATLEKFKAGEIRLLVCSDVAARGIDIGGLSHVFNFDVPFHAEDYVHRIGRTGRAGREGHAYSIGTAEDARSIAAIEALTGKPIPRMVVEGLASVSDEELAEAARAPRGRGRGKPAAKGGRAPARAEAKPRPEEKPRREEAPRRSGGEVARRGLMADGARRARDERNRLEGDPLPLAATAPLEMPVEAALPVLAEPAPRRSRDEHRRDRDEPRRDRHEGERRPRDPRPEPRREAARAEPARDDRALRDERPGRDDRPVRDDRPARDDRRPRRDERRDRDDLGPPVRGFGDAIPAFMLIPIPRPQRDTGVAESDAEAA
jgi:superfamily II DNA/RNA helicase